ncbi:MAG: hypothetical protein COC05_06035 [Gammaproteobacteria bacterium]|nr:MAG: hypothetical protein COC05_06035 [Gammaproteobacteria bacterium]
MNEVMTPISFGELIDKITILEIKSERITDQDKLKNVRHELSLLSAIWQQHRDGKIDISQQWNALREINGKLWTIEDDIRDLERDANFGEEFIALARAVYFTNDVRAKQKREINIALGSTVVEEKSYADYSRPGDSSATI